MQPRPGWELWLDCHLSPIIAKWLNEATSLTVKSAYKLKLHGLTDEQIYRLAKGNVAKVIIVSKDSDLPHLVLKFGTPPKLINLKIGNTGNGMLFQFLLSRIEVALHHLIDEDLSIIDIL